MQSALLPDTADEVVEVFTGDSLEQAMAYAVATLGPDLVVRRARKLRKGVQGLRGKETYEVAAVPAPRATTASSDDVLEDAFASLLQEAETREEAQQAPAPRVRRTTRASAPPAPAVVLPTPRVAPAPAPSALEPAPAPAPEPVPVRLAPPAAQPPAPKAARRTAQRPAPRTAQRPAATSRPRTTTPRPRKAAGPAPAGTPVWSRAALASLGLPRRVLAGLPARDPRSDLAWVGALEKAFAAVLPPAAPASATQPAVVCGYGVAGVVAILAAASRGMTPGTITDQGRTAPATPTELALVVRAALVR